MLRLFTAEPAAAAVLVVAPPGYGKTVLLADWAAQEQRDVAWLTLGEFDNDPSVFLTYIAAAIDRVEPIDPSFGGALKAQGTRILAEAVPRLASELHGWRRPGVLVLDDVHRLEDRTCLDALASLLDHLPPGFRVVMASRTTPDLPVGRLRANRALLEIGKDELAFDAQEAEALAAAAGLRLSRDQAQALAERTEGWAAAIYLAALAHERDATHIVGAGEVSGRDGYVAEYLRSELRPILDDLDVTLLTRTSIVDVLEPGIAEAVSALPDATERLRRLAHANLLIGELPGKAPSYRYHHLLRDYLEADLERREPGSRPELHRRASAWYLDAGRPELAIEHSIASGDTDAAAILVEGASLRTYLLGHGDRLTRWLRAFDDEAFTRRPTLAVGAAMVFALSGRPDEAERMADIVERVDVRRCAGQRVGVLRVGPVHAAGGHGPSRSGRCLPERFGGRRGREGRQPMADPGARGARPGRPDARRCRRRRHGARGSGGRGAPWRQLRVLCARAPGEHRDGAW